jgi:uncharacterized protein (DUF362 family)
MTVRPQVAIRKAENIPESPSQFTEKSLKPIENLLVETLSLVIDYTTMVKGKTVFIKPNLVRPNLVALPAVTTDPRVILALTRLTLRCGAKKVMVGDIPGYKVRSCEALALSELTDSLKEIGAIPTCLDEDEIIEIANPKGIVLKRLKLPETALKSDVFINLPKLKTHMHTMISLGIKNLHGLILDEQRLMFHRQDINYKVVDILHAIKPHLTIIDGIWALEGQAPLHGNTVKDFNTIIAGENVNAVDAVGSYVMGFDPEEIATCRIARMQGFGPYNLHGIDIKGEELKTIKRYFKRAVISSAGVFENVNVIEGGVCAGCLSALRHSLDRIEFEGKIKKLPKITVYAGIPMPNAITLSDWDGDLFCLGNCASSLVLKQDHVGQPATFIPGCAPHVLDFKHILVEKYKL